MKATNKSHILGRYAVIIVFMVFIALLIVCSLFKTTVVRADLWNNKADSLLALVTPIEPQRGKILSDSGAVLAANLNYYVPRIDWTVPGFKEKAFRDSLPRLADSLHAFDPSRTAKQWREELLAQIEAPRLMRKKSYRLFKELTHNEYKRIKRFPFFCLPSSKNGLYTESIMRRVKPYGSMAARSIGNVSRNDNGRGGIHGRSGLEMALDSLLYGVAGTERRIPLNSGITKWTVDPAISGYDITTTINIGLQDIVETELYDMCRETDASWATAVLMETATGEIKAISNLEWNDKVGDYIEGTNHAVLGYEPGSVMKPISMMVALENGTVGLNTPAIATGSTMMYCGRPINDPHGAASLTPVQIIETSSNIGMSKITLMKYENNPDGFRKRLEEMGFFDPYNTGIAGEQLPYVPHLRNDRGGRLTLTRACYGYATQIPPMRILAMYNAIANNGKYVRPRLVRKLSRAGSPDSIVPVSYIREQVCSPENAAKLREMLHAVVWGAHGTARKWVQDDNVEIAGKTGTAYIASGGSYGAKKRLAFCGFFPYKNPKYTCVVLMAEANRGAGASSGVVVKNIALKMYARGLLGNKSDYESGSSRDASAEMRPMLYGSMNRNMNANVRKGLSIGTNVRVIATPKPCDGVPDVRGLNVREATVILERAGLNVKVDGLGYVSNQSLAPGSGYHRGEQIRLHLRL